VSFEVLLTLSFFGAQSPFVGRNGGESDIASAAKAVLDFIELLRRD